MNPNDFLRQENLDPRSLREEGTGEEDVRRSLISRSVRSPTGVVPVTGEVTLTDEHKLIQITSHVTSMVGRVGVVGLCSCGWIAGEEGEDTRSAANRLHETWEVHTRRA
jgi:hypothetical protein